MGAVAFLAPAARVSRMWNGGARDGADVDALAVRLMHLETRGALAVGLCWRLLDPVPGVRAHKDGLPDDVVVDLTARAETQRVANL